MTEARRAPVTRGSSGDAILELSQRIAELEDDMLAATGDTLALRVHLSELPYLSECQQCTELFDRILTALSFVTPKDPGS